MTNEQTFFGRPDDVMTVRHLTKPFAVPTSPPNAGPLRSWLQRACLVENRVLGTAHPAKRDRIGDARGVGDRLPNGDLRPVRRGASP